SFKVNQGKLSEALARNPILVTALNPIIGYQKAAMLPLVADNLLHSIQLLANVSRLLADKAIASFKVNQGKLSEALARNPILVTALNPIIGYQKAA
ncbi:hypothetical protein ACXKGW_29915, partial [Klebsiella pneumoniae subsp. pneumoniae]